MTLVLHINHVYIKPKQPAVHLFKQRFSLQDQLFHDNLSSCYSKISFTAFFDFKGVLNVEECLFNYSHKRPTILL